jgi:hypothetical protein
VRVCAHRADPALTAVVVRQTPLHYADGADPATDRPAHVRAGSSLARVPGGIAVIQDDANFIAVVATDGSVSCITLPADATGQRQFDDNRGNKRRKLDLEACVSMATGGGTLLVALGSGSRPTREQVALVEWTADSGPVVTVTNAAGMYAALRAVPEFAGSQLNLEGAVQVATRLRLFGRGNGATRGDLRPVNATCDLDWPALLAHLRAPGDIPAPAPQRVVQHELGRLQGVALGFTDATPSLARSKGCSSHRTGKRISLRSSMWTMQALHPCCARSNCAARGSPPIARCAQVRNRSRLPSRRE